jgi:peptidyl-prolyl isomerase E (cyclophilin E)
MSLELDKHRGFAFVEFEDEDDAHDAIDNMDGSEIFGRVVRCNVAKAIPKLTAGKAVWNSEEWINQNLNNSNEYRNQEIAAEITLIPNKTDDDEEELYETNV